MDGEENEPRGPHGDRAEPRAGSVGWLIPDPSLPLSPLFPLPSRRILVQDGVADAVRRSRYYEKPTRARRRRAFEACRRVYCAEMARKIAFLARSARQDPWPGC